MSIDIRLIISLIISLSVISGAYSIEIGGGSFVVIGAESFAQGRFAADSSAASSTVKTAGIVPHAGELRYVQDDDDGKRAEISFNVTGAVGTVGYTAKFTPKEGNVGSVPSVSASQSLKVPKADSIILHSAAQSSPGSDVVNVNLSVNKTDMPASFSGSIQAQATASTTLAKIQGKVTGAINGIASYGGYIGGPYDDSLMKNSDGGKIDCNLLMRASSTEYIGTLDGVSTFTVDPTEKIQDAVNASWDGDIINVAKGTYKENVAVDTSVTIKGAGLGKTIVDGQRKGSVFIIGYFNPNVVVTLSDVTITKGNATNGGGIDNEGTLTLKNSQITENNAELGGGIYNFGDLTITNCKITENTAQKGGGMYNDWILNSLKNTYFANSANPVNSVGGYGGGIYNNNEAFQTSDIISGNDALYGGGLINFGTDVITKSSITGNYASNNGGGISTVGDSYLDLTSSTISGNFADYGAGIDCEENAQASISSSKISSNSGAFAGGGIYSNARLSIARSTISGNSAVYGSAVTNHGSLDIESTTVSGNNGYYGTVFNNGSMNIIGSKISSNKAGWGGAVFSKVILNLTGSTLSSNTAISGGGFYSSGTAYVNSSTITGNKALYGGGIYNDGTLFVGGTSQIASNQATSGFGGGIFSSASTVTFDGTKAFVKANKAHQPSSTSIWQNYGVFIANGIPKTTGLFDLTKQVIGNTKI